MRKYTNSEFNAALNRVAGTEDGKIVLAALKQMCAWDTTICNSSDPEATQFYAAQRGVYGAIRKLIRPEYLKEIEFDYQLEAESTHGRSSTSSRNTGRTD